nr:hypothetical protein [uncultured Methanoregula sp.]
MPGFFGICNYPKTTTFVDLGFSHIGHVTIVENEICTNNFFVKRFVISKFLQDKIFFENNDICVCTDGILLNAQELRREYGVDDNKELIKSMYKINGIKFISKLRGDFSGVIYDKSEKVVKLFTNHIGSKPVYYFWDKSSKTLIFSSELKVVLKIMRDLTIPTKLSEIGAYCLLSFGYMLRDYTLCDKVKKILPGTILSFGVDEGIIYEDRYYQLKNMPYIESSREAIIEEMDRRFSEAIKKEYDKDLEYGYRHIATLSGGLDSRMNIMTAEKMDYKNILAITFSQSNYLDEMIAKKIASDRGYNFLFFALDNGNYLIDIERPVHANDGLILYPGSAHLLAMISLLDWSQNGLLHTGMIGDVILGSFLITNCHGPLSNKIIKNVVYSRKLVDRIPNQIFEDMRQEYESDEIFAFYERMVNGVFNGYLMIQHYTDFSSPFLYLDFLEYTMRIPPKYRYKEKLYFDWIQTKNPDASAYIWEKTKLRISAGEWKIFLLKVLNKIQRKIRGPSDKDSMNPLDYWYKTNPELRNTFNSYYKQHIAFLDDYPSLKEDSRDLFEHGNTLEKSQVLTLIVAMKVLQLK